MSYEVAFGSDNTMYAVGYFVGTVDFDSGAGTEILTSMGGGDAFVAKLDAAGAHVWARNMGGSLSDEAYSLALDGDDSVYTTGRFHGTADFDPGPGTENLVSAGDRDIFVSKFDSGGDYVWARRMGASGVDLGAAVALAPDGRVGRLRVAAF